MLAADYLYSLEARPGVPDVGFGFSHAANGQFHVVANYSNPESTNEPGFHGEIQVHDANTGDLLRTIQNPLPFIYETEHSINAFGYAVDIYDNLILVGSPGWEGRFVYDPEAGDDVATGGRAFLFDANTGDLLHTFDGTANTLMNGLNNDGFGSAVSIDGNRIAIGAHGTLFLNPELTQHDNDPGRVYVYSATTGNLLHLIESADISPSPYLDFGATVSLSDGKLVVTQGAVYPDDLGLTFGFGPTLVYDVQTGNLLHTLSDDDSLASRAVIKGNIIAVGVLPGTTNFVNATSGVATQTIAAHLYDFDGNLIVAGPASGDSTAFPMIRDFPSGNILYAVPTPPNFVEAYWEYNQIPQVFGDRLFVPGRQGPANENVVFVYSVTDAPVNSPPTDIALSNNSVPENSANGTVVGALTATDPTPGETLTFSMVVSAGGRFGINGTNLVVADGSLLNFEANTSHSVTVRVTDSASNTFDEVFTINVSDVNEAATLISLTPSTESENTTNGAVVGLLASDDPDGGETETYELLDDAGGRFERVGLQIRVANASLLDFETASSHQINVRVTDSAAHVLEQVLTINITDFNYTPTDILLSGNTVPEGAINAYFNPSQTPGVGFGYDIAASADRFLVGMNAVTASGQAGTVSVYSRTTGQVTQTLVSPTPQVGQLFGEHVAMDGDLAVVSARLATGGGAVHLFDVSNGTLLRTLTSPLPASAGFGDSVAISGNLIAVGGGAGNGYRVFLFDATDGSLIATLLSPNVGGEAGFGLCVKIAGNSIVIGQIFGAVGGVMAGVAYVYQFDPGTEDVTLLSTLNNPSPDFADGFGIRLALSGNTVVVGAHNDDTDGTNSGRAYVFNATTGTLLRTISNPTPANEDLFGIGIDISGNRVTISANSEDTGASNAGATYLFDLNSGDLLTTIQKPLPNDNDFFGSAVAFSGSSILVGVGNDDTTGLNAGAVYRYDLPVAEVVGQLTAVDPESTESFTWQLTDNAGGRFGLDGTNLVVADPTLLNFEDASSHDVVVQVTDSGGLQYSKTFTIQVTDVAENAQFLNGTSGDDFYSVLYSSTDVNSGTVTVQVSTNGGPVTTIGTFPMNQPLFINGHAGTDLAQVLGTSGSDIVEVQTASKWIINSSTLFLSDFETRSLGGGPGNDQYFFDVDTPLGAIILVENAVVGTDRIDFSPTTTVAVSVNLSLNGLQAIHATNLNLHLPNPDTIENLIGGSMNDDLIGNTVANTITGGPGNDAITGAGGNDNLFGGLGDDKFVFNAVTSAEADYIAEYFNQGTDTITFASMPIDVSINLASVAVQTVHVDRTLTLNSAITFENLIGGAGNDSLISNSRNNVLIGNSGADYIYDAAGNDTLIGGEGNDFYVFQSAPVPEFDSVQESANSGTDILSFSNIPVAVTLDLSSTAIQPVHVNRTLQLSSDTGFETVFTHSGNFNDVLIGNSRANSLHSGGGNDTLNGRGGDDGLVGGTGNDTYVFSPATAPENDVVSEFAGSGSGIDTLDLSLLSDAVTFNLGTASIQNVHLNRTLKLASAITVENIIGGSVNDTLTGNTIANTITGGPGNDTITGADGNDTLNGGSGDDGLSGGLGNDTYVFTTATVAELDSVAEMPNEGTDTVDFSAIMSDVAYDATISQLQNVHLNRSFAAQALAVAIENMIGGSANDVLTGNTFANTITGGPGNDTLTGAGGNDLLFGGTGDDTFVFNAVTTAETDYVAEYFDQGTDTISFASLAINVNFSLTTIAAQSAHTDRTLSLASAITVENLTGGSGNDQLRGNSLNNLLTGNSGGDQIFGGAGSDILVGGPGDDQYSFVDPVGLENDSMTELDNEGNDRVSFTGGTSGVTMTLASTSVQPIQLNRTVQLSSGLSFENLLGSTGNDVLTGNAFANLLFGVGGNDTLNGAAGSDSLYGGPGDDTFVFTPAPVADIVHEWFNQGTDTLDFSALSDAATINAGSIAVQNVHLNRTIQLVSAITLENIIGGSGDDDLRGNFLANTLTGNSGDDRLNGVDGNDSLIGGIGDDIYVFGTMTTAAETDTVTEQLGEGNDFLSFASLSSVVTVNLASNVVQSVHTNRSLQLNSGVTVENVLGGSAADVLFGNTLDNRLVGNDGDDVLVGGDGNDFLNGGIGRDILIGGNDLDAIFGGADDDILIAGTTSSDSLPINLVDLRIEWTSPQSYATRITNLRAGVGASLASLQAGINVLDDSAAIDTLTGDAGTDWYLRALDDVITDLFAGETIDLL